MKSLREHIIFRVLIFLLIAALSTPYFVKLAHIFTHHKHEVCLGEKATHLHELDLDCEFYKFKLTNNFTFSFFNFDIISIKEKQVVIVSQYNYLSEYQRLQTSLRGPPVLI